MSVSRLVILAQSHTRRCFYFHWILDNSQMAEGHRVTEPSASVIVAFYICIYHKNKKTKTPSMRLFSFRRSKCSIMWCRKCCHSKLLSKLPEWGFSLADAGVVDSSRVLTLLRFPLARRRFRSLHPRCTSPSQMETLRSVSPSWIFHRLFQCCLDFWVRPQSSVQPVLPNQAIYPNICCETWH